MTRDIPRQQGFSLKVSLLHLIGLVAFAVAQPVFDIIARYPEFLVAHRAGTLEILVLILVLAVAPAVLLWFLEILIGLFSVRLRTALHLLFSWLLLTVIVVPLLVRMSLLPAAAVLMVAGLLGGLATRLIFWTPIVRRNLALIAVAAPLFCFLFVLNPAINPLVFPSSPAAGGPAITQTGTPIVFVIFDELPVTSLLDASGGIDPVLYPNFAALAAQANWYPNATTVSGATMKSIPAFLTGMCRNLDHLPIPENFPDNLFALVDGKYRIIAEEPQTRLCPDNQRLLPTRLRYRINSLLDDTWIVFQNVILPHGVAARSAQLGARWTDFGVGTDPKTLHNSDRRGQVDRFHDFLDSIEAGDRPVLAFIHSILPHNPYHLMPTGTVYNYRRAVPQMKNKIWPEDELLVMHSYRRSLLQLQYVDGLLGKLVTRLQDEGLFDPAVMVVTADHGASYHPGDSHRKTTATNLADIMSVPLIIKLPHQEHGLVDERFVQSMDVLPTIVAALGIEPPWTYDGWSLLDPDGRDREELVFADQKTTIPRTTIANREIILKKKLAAFGDGSTPDGLYRFGPFGHLIDQDPRPLIAAEATNIYFELNKPERLQAVHPERGFVPAEITGTLHGTQDFAESLDLALAINGTIAAVTSTYKAPDGSHKVEWCALTRETAIAAGHNVVELFQIETIRDSIRLHPIPKVDAH